MVNLVSVVIPSYNHERYIIDALMSVFEQTHPLMEIIVIDDHSEDATFALARDRLQSVDFKKRFKRIIYVSNDENVGAHNALNTGLSLARGKWVSLLNSDDRYHPDRIAKLLALANKERAKFVFSGTDFLYDNEVTLSDLLLMKRIFEAQRNSKRYPSLRDALFHFNFCATTGNMFFQNEVFKKVGGFAELRYCHDWDFVMRAAEYFKLAFAPELLYSYRFHGNNSFKSLADVGRSESERVAKGVRERASETIGGSLAWKFGTCGLISSWLGY